MIRVGIQLDFAGGYGRDVLRGVMEYANLQTDWEFVMPPMYSLMARKIDPKANDGVVAMVHAARSIRRYRRAGIPLVNTARTVSTHELQHVRLPTVVPNDAAVGRMAFEYFWERHFRSFGFCGHSTAASG